MSKSLKVVILLIMAVLCAAIAGFSIYSYCNSTKGFIYVFKTDYKAGTPITKDMFTSMKVDQKIITAGQTSGLETYYITDKNFNSVVEGNEYLLNDVIANKPLTFVDLAYTSGSQIERSLSEDTMAVSIPISGTAAVTDELRVGSIVNIYCSDAAGTRLLFENMKIIDRNTGGNITTVTFKTSADDALDLINATNNYRLYFSLVSPIEDANKHSGYVQDSQTPNTSISETTEE